jgi:retinoid hydroxylase
LCKTSSKIGKNGERFPCLPELYTDRDRFAPPREEDKKHPLAIVGFGHGLHSCLGMEFAQMEMKIVFSTLLRHYDWTVKPDYSAIALVFNNS